LSRWIVLFTEILGEQLKQGVKITVDDLNSYLSSKREDADRQNEQYESIKRESEEMMLRMRELEPLVDVVQHQQSEITTLRQVSVNIVKILYCWFQNHHRYQVCESGEGCSVVIAP